MKWILRKKKQKEIRDGHLSVSKQRPIRDRKNLEITNELGTEIGQSLFRDKISFSNQRPTYFRL